MSNGNNANGNETERISQQLLLRLLLSLPIFFTSSLSIPQFSFFFLSSAAVCLSVFAYVFFYLRKCNTTHFIHLVYRYAHGAYKNIDERYCTQYSLITFLINGKHKIFCICGMCARPMILAQRSDRVYKLMWLHWWRGSIATASKFMRTVSKSYLHYGADGAICNWLASLNAT